MRTVPHEPHRADGETTGGAAGGLLSVVAGAKRSARLTDMLKLSRPLPGPAPRGAGQGARTPLPAGFCAVALDAAGVEDLERCLPYASGAPLPPRVFRGHRCYAAVRADGEVEAFAWLATGPTSLYVYELAAEASIPEGVAFVYEVFTFPRARNLGLAGGLVSVVAETLAAERDAGRRDSPERLEAWVEGGNAPSLRVFSRLGFEAYGRWRVAALGPARVLRGDPSIPREVPGRRSRAPGGAAAPSTRDDRRKEGG